ncbi:MAG: Gfo/Idh/MocA family protein [Candidatus Eisenbacteria bacterium]
MSRIRVAILGTSFGRQVQAVGFQRHPGCELVAIAGSDAAKTTRIAEELGIPHAFDDWRRLLDEAACEVVSVATPVDLHHPMVMAALERGRHVLCEKPTALHRFQAAEMRDAARRAGLVAGMNHEFRFLPARRAAVERVRSGDIGVPRRVEILGRYPIWDRPESRAMTWLSDAARGGGILGALGSHHTDCVRTLLGEPRAVTASVRVSQPGRGPTATRPESGIATADDACTLMLECDGGATALIDLDATSPYRWERYEVHGSEGSLRWAEGGATLWRLVAGREPEPLSIPDAMTLTPREGDPALVAPFGVVVDRLHAAITRGETMEPSLDDGVAVQSVIDAARESSEAGSRIAVEIPRPVVA